MENITFFLKPKNPHYFGGLCWLWLLIFFLPTGRMSAQCSPDVTPPICTAPPNMTITKAYYQSLNIDLHDSLQMIGAFGAVSYSDNCTNANLLVLATYSVVTFQNGSPKEITRSFLVIDDAGNSSQVGVQVITILPGNSMVHIPAWFYPGDTGIDSLRVVSASTELLAHSFEDEIFNEHCTGQLLKTERTHTFIDWLTYDPNLDLITLPALDVDADGQTGDAYDLVFVGDSLWRVENGQITTALAPKFGGYKYLQVIRYNYLDTLMPLVAGTVFLDTLDNCSLDANEPLLAHWAVKAIANGSGHLYTGTTDANGHYQIAVCPGDTLLEVSLDVPFNFGQSCSTVYPVTVSTSQTNIQNIPVKLETKCPLLSADLAALRIRPCFPGEYHVSFCNLSNEIVPDAHVEVTLDTFLQYNSSSIAGTALGGNRYAFPLGDLEPGTCGTFIIGFTANCAAPVGITHCSEAHIFPDSICVTNAAWSGAWLKASAACDGDSVRLSLKNVGSAPMATSLEFVIVEDLIMYMNTPFQLGAGEVETITRSANGATWRIQAPQEALHPWGGTVAAFVEGCGGLSQSGLPLAFPVNGSDPFVTTDCMVNVSSFDPNDKQAVPGGYGEQHFIEKNTDLEYTIRFQNTGTDTAYTVVILDTLSAYLDVRSIAPGAASHGYDFDILDGQVLRFRFDHINLPDSSTNLSASQGFFKYRVQQIPDNPDGRLIENSAAIYFDYNAPVITNTTYHVVGSNFVVVNTDETTARLGALKVFPNPSSSEVWFEMPEKITEAQFTLVNAFGKSVRQTNISGNRYRFDRALLPGGVYFFKIQTNEAGAYSGKILLR